MAALIPFQAKTPPESGGNGGNCVEVEDILIAVVVGDTKWRDGPQLGFGRNAWTVFAGSFK